MPYKDPDRRRAVQQKSAAKRRAVQAKSEMEALSAPDLPDAPDDDELVRLLGVKARQGNVPAMKLLLERPWEKRDGDSNPQPQKSKVDELAERRASRAS